MSATTQFEYGTAKVREFSVAARRNEVKKGRGSAPRVTATGVSINGRECKPSKRFWTSIQCRFGFSPNIFRYFDHAEVFERISQKAPTDEVRYCIEHDTASGKDTILAVTNPNISAVKYETLNGLLEQYGAEGVTYTDGIVRSTHKPRNNNTPFQVASDDFINQFIIDTPIDGFGRPNIYLSLMRLICANGAIGYSKAFRSEISTGKRDEDVSFALTRAIDGFNNEEGFAALRQRFDAATNSWASVNETQRLYRSLASLAGNGELVRRGREVVHTIDGPKEVETCLPIFNDFHKMTGDLTSIYGMADIDTLSVKRQRALPTPCKVYDLLNFATEVATHYAHTRGGRRLQAFVGDMITSEYDLEGTCDQFSDYNDFFIHDVKAADAMQAIKAKV